MILSIIFSVISLVVFVFQLFTMEKGNRFFLSGATLLVCCEYQLTQKKLSCRSYHGGCQWRGQLSTRGSETALYNLLAWLFVLMGRTPDSDLK